MSGFFNVETTEKPPCRSLGNFFRYPRRRLLPQICSCRLALYALGDIPRCALKKRER